MLIPRPPGAARAPLARSRGWRVLAALTLAAPLALTSCWREEPSATLPTGLMLVQAPPGVQPLEQARTGLKPGDRITFSGRIGGSMEPFGERTALMLVMGDGLLACSDVEGVNCKTPWDYCCDNESVRAEHSALVRVLDRSGKPIGVGLKGLGGLRELARVTVVGRVASVDESGRLVVDAEGLWVAQGEAPPTKTGATPTTPPRP